MFLFWFFFYCNFSHQPYITTTTEMACRFQPSRKIGLTFQFFSLRSMALLLPFTLLNLQIPSCRTLSLITVQQHSLSALCSLCFLAIPDLTYSECFVGRVHLATWPLQPIMMIVQRHETRLAVDVSCQGSEKAVQQTVVVASFIKW